MKLFAFGTPICLFAAMVALDLAGIDVAKLPAQTGSVTYTDRNGGVLGTVLGADSAHAASVPLDSVSPDFINAIVAAEDARFWHHGAIDVPALLRAARDFAVYGEVRSGGSTIAMQLARLLGPLSTPLRVRRGRRFAQSCGRFGRRSGSRSSPISARFSPHT